MSRVRTERVCGPYFDSTRRQPYAVHFIRTDGRRRVVRVATEAEAVQLIRAGRASAQGRTVTGAIAAYLEHKRGKLRPSSIVTLGYRLHGILRTSERDALLRDLKPMTAARLYEKRVAETRADTHQGELTAVQSWAAWCIKQGWILVNPFAAVETVGRKSAGKTQHRVTESRGFVDVALAEGSPAGVAAVCAVLMGLGASEVALREVRDVDDGGRLFWIDEGKTENRKRHIIVPEVLRDRLLALTIGRPGNAPLFGMTTSRNGQPHPVDRHWFGYHVRRLCKLAGVPVITPHSLRGLHGSLSVSAGIEVEHVAHQLGHGGTGVTRRHYIAPGVEAAAGQERALSVIQGGRR